MYFEWVKEGFWRMSKNQILSHPMRDSGTVMESTMSWIINEFNFFLCSISTCVDLFNRFPICQNWWICQTRIWQIQNLTNFKLSNKTDLANLDLSNKNDKLESAKSNDQKKTSAKVYNITFWLGRASIIEDLGVN